MSVLAESDFEAEAIDLDQAPGQKEIFPGDSNHYLMRDTAYIVR